MIKCPPKNNAFGLLKSGLGEARSHIAFQRNGFEVPEIEKALDLLGVDKPAWRDSRGRTLHQVQTLDATAKAARESGAVLPKSETSALIGKNEPTVISAQRNDNRITIEVDASGYIPKSEELNNRFKSLGHDVEFTRIESPIASAQKVVRFRGIVVDESGKYSKEAAKKAFRDAFGQDDAFVGKVAKPEPIAAQSEIGTSKVRVGTNPTLHTVIRELPKAQGDLPDEKFYEVKNDKTGAVQTVEAKDLKPVNERTAEDKLASKPVPLDEKLRAFKLDPSSFPDADSKREALKRAKVTSEPAANLGEGLPEGQGSTDDQINAAIKGENTHGFDVQIISKDEAEQIGGITEARGYGGFFKDGKIYLLRENIRPNQPEALRQLLREEVGHGLLRTPDGVKLFNAFRDNAARQLTDAEKKVLTDAGYQPYQLLDEFIAKSMREKRPWWNEAVLTVKSWLAKLGLKLSNDEAARLLLRQIKSRSSDAVSSNWEPAPNLLPKRASQVKREKIMADAEKASDAAYEKNKAIVEHVPKDENDEDSLELWNVSSPAKGNKNSAIIFKTGPDRFEISNENGSSIGISKDLESAISDAKDHVESGQSTDMDVAHRDARSEIFNTLELPPDFSIKGIQDTKWDSVYYLLRKKIGEDEDGEPEYEDFKVSIRNHDPSPFREKEFGANDAWYEVPKDASLEQIAQAVTKVENFAWRHSDEAPAAGPPVGDESTEQDTDSEGRPIQVGGRKFLGSESQLADQVPHSQIVASADKAKALVTGLKLPGAVDNEADSIIFKIDGDSNVGTDGKPAFPYDAEVGRLRDEIVKLLSDNSDESLNLAIQLSKFINYNHDEWPKLVSKPLADEIRGLAAAKSSRAGQILRMLKGSAIGKDLRSVVRNLDFSLKRVWSKNFGGDAYQSFVTRIVRNFSEFFSPDELDKFGKDNPDIQSQVELVAATARAEQANRLYRKIQSKLNPKNITPAKLEKNAVAREEFDALIQQLEKIGVEIPEKNNPKMSAREKLLLLVKDKTIKKVNADVEAAVKYGLSEAGKQSARNELMGNKDALEELEARFLAGEEPTPEQIEKGLELHAFRGIKGLRDSWLGYDPVTVKLAQDIVKEDFKGVRFGTPKVRPADTRLNLAELAKQPDSEVARVLDAYLKNIADNLDLSGATPETRQRIRATIEKQVADQIENVVRPKVRDIMFKAPKEKGAAKTDEQKLAEQVNAGLFGDERLNVPEMVQRVASKSIVQNLTPKVADIAKAILDSPSFKQADMEKAIFDAAVAKLDVDPTQMKKLADVIYASLKPKIDEARAIAQKKAVDSLTPREQKVMPKSDNKLWKSIEDFFHAGGKDYDELLKKLAASRGLPIPSPAETARMKALADKVDELSNLTPEAEARIRNNPSFDEAEKSKALENARAEKEKLNASEIGRATTQMGVEWAKFTKPFNWVSPDWSSPKSVYDSVKSIPAGNISRGAYEYAVANLLAKFGFSLRLSIHIASQLLVRTPTRPIAVALQRFYTDRAAGEPTDLLKDISKNIGDTVGLSLKTIPQAWRAGRAQLMARGEVNADRLLGSVNALERMVSKAKELDAKGDHVRALILKTVAFVRMSTRAVGAIDAFQGEFVEATELRNQIQTELSKLGKSRAEIAKEMHNVFGNMALERTLALTDAKRGFDEQDKEVSEKALNEAADRLLKERMYQKIELMGLPRDSVRAYILRQRMAEAWQAPTEQGLGGVLTQAMKLANKFTASIASPIFPVYFSNAIGAAVNYHLRLTPAYFLGDVRWNKNAPVSAWSESSLDRTHRQVVAVVGAALGSAAVALVLSNYVKAQLHSPQDKNEREKWTAQGHKVGTIEFQLPNGDFIPFSLTVGPFALLAPYFAAAGQLRTVLDGRAKKQAALEAQAAKSGLPAGKLPPMSVADLLGVAGQAAWSSILGGSTASGLISSYSEFQVPNAQKAVAATIAPLIPYLPGLQELSRMDGVALDSKTATVFDYLLPLPTSSARAVNALGDPVKTPNDLQRIIQAITGGTYPGIVSSEPDAAYDEKTKAAYSALLSSKFTPPEVNPAKGYAIDGTFRPMTPQELEHYTELRGQYLKTNLAALGESATPQQAKQAYQQANAQALADIGIQSGAASRSSVPRGTKGKSRLSLGRSRTSGGLKISLKKLRRPTSHRTRKLHLWRTAKTHSSRVRLHRQKYV